MGAKARQRLVPIGMSTAVQLAPAVIGVVSSWLVVRYSDATVWGEVVYLIIFAVLGMQVLNWGGKDFLLRAFAGHPDKVVTMWKRVTLTRSLILFMVFPAIWLSGLEAERAPYLMLWILAGFIRQSYDPIIVARKEYLLPLLTEIGALALIVSGIMIKKDALNAEYILQLFAFSYLLRAVIMSLRYYREFLMGAWPRIAFQYFALALPFFLLGFVGMLSNRTDLYCVAWLLDEGAVGRYQVMASMFIYLQSVSGLIIHPFTREVYRLRDSQILQLSNRLLPLGLAISALGVPLTWALLNYAYHFQIAWETVAWGFLYMLPIFHYSSRIYLLFKHHAQTQVLLASAGGVLVNLGMNILLIPRMELAGALASTAAGQVFTLVMLEIYVRNLPRKAAQPSESDES